MTEYPAIKWQDIEWQDIEWQDIEWQDIERQDIEWQDIEWQDIEWNPERANNSIPKKGLKHEASYSKENSSAVSVSSDQLFPGSEINCCNGKTIFFDMFNFNMISYPQFPMPFHGS